MKVPDPLTGGTQPIEQSPYAIDHDEALHRVDRFPGSGINPYCRDCERVVHEASGDL